MPTPKPPPQLEIPALKRIQAIRADVGESSSRLIDYIVCNPKTVLSQSITELAEAAASSEPTAVRLFRRAGFRSFQDFKIRLAQSLVPGVSSLNPEIAPSDTALQVLEKVFATSQITLKETLAHMDEEVLEQAVQRLLSARKIEVVGCGVSGIVALDTAHKFSRLGLLARSHHDPHFAAQVCALTDPDDLVLAISHTGSTRDVLDAVEQAKDNGATVIALTGLRRSPLTQLADLTLRTSSPESSYRSEAIASRIAQLCMVDALCVTLHLRLEPHSSERLRKTREALKDKRL
ncbi:MurR/RpiR family transcriptional regulator [uncultured Meiothermus sp.]|jgi:RpiR family carbohydrate utilization transcriptional regulator|uniref:MurR/RpiR family transcriptional regulator n=1 Tax=uncultured Meiothermus sp. TaxID=157471 RepID=UPI00262CA1E5|nr:MurR/RpiR family transcriptional regulator [uncultured Meiothermus sp.]